MNETTCDNKAATGEAVGFHTFFEILTEYQIRDIERIHFQLEELCLELYAKPEADGKYFQVYARSHSPSGFRVVGCFNSDEYWVFSRCFGAFLRGYAFRGALQGFFE